MNDKQKEKREDAQASGNVTCGECGSDKVQTVIDIYKFNYGIAPDSVELSCEVPLRKCEECGFRFLDNEAEEICHETICRHLGVMSPAQIKSLRKYYKLTQSQFADTTKLGEATLSRWERGIIIQNNAYDNYLYLLGFSDNFRRLQKRQEKEIHNTIEGIDTTKATFKEIKMSDELRQKQQEFELRPCLITRE